jgi:2-phosphoglycerate kinase
MIFLIGGIARSGKSIVRDRILEEYSISGISTDSIRYMLSNTQPELGIDHKQPSRHNAPLMWPYLENFIYALVEYSGQDFVLEGDVLFPEYLSKYVNNPEVKCCYIGYSNASVESKYNEIVKYRYEGDWTKHYSEEQLKKFLKSGIKRSKKYKKECEKFGVKYFDTGENFLESIDEIVENLSVD